MMFGRGGTPIQPRGLNRGFNRLFRAHPIAFPLGLIILGGAYFAFVFFFYHRPFGVLLAAVAIMAMIFGVVTLPFGIWTAVQRRVKVVVLRCPDPACRAESRKSFVKFDIERPPDVDYAVVTCSRCHQEFAVDKFARLE